VVIGFPLCGKGFLHDVGQGHLPSAMGESAAKRSRACSSLAPMSTAMSCRLAPVLAGGVDSVGQPLHGLVDQAGEQVDQHGLIADPQAAAFGQGGDGVVDDVVAVLIDAGRGKAAHELCPVQVSTASIRNARCESRAWAAASAVAAASARMVGQQDGRGHQISFVVKVFFVVAGPGRRARSGSGSWSNWLLRLPRRPPAAGIPLCNKDFRHRAGVVAAAAGDTRGRRQRPDRSRPCPACSLPAGVRRGSGPPRRGGSLTGRRALLTVARASRGWC